MTMSQAAIAEQWINDYLDLYNLALQCGDLDWQAELREKLRAQRNVHLPGNEPS